MESPSAESSYIDTMHRDEFINQVITVINAAKEQKNSTSFSISGGWGYGKSFVLQKLESELSKEDYADIQIIHYNCWKYSYYDEPLIALISSIADQLSKFENISKSLKEFIPKAMQYMLKESALAVGSSLSKKITGIDFIKAGEEAYKTLKNGFNEFNLPDYDTNSSLRKSIYIMHTVLNELANKKHLVLIIDELDRCLPEYQIKLLERIHHLIEGTNLITIYAINPEQLKQTVTKMYGGDSNERINSYLRKFIDFNISLPIGIPSDNLQLRYKENLSFFQPIHTIPCDIDFSSFIADIFSECDARTIEKIWAKQIMIHKLTYYETNFLQDKPPLEILCVELLFNIMINWQKKTVIKNTLVQIKPENNICAEMLLLPIFKPESYSNNEKKITHNKRLWSLWENISTNMNSSSFTYHKNKDNQTVIKLPNNTIPFLKSIGIYWCNATNNKFLIYDMDEPSVNRAASYYYEQFQTHCNKMKQFYLLANIID